MDAFWDVASCYLVDVYRSWRGACCFLHQGGKHLLHVGARLWKTVICIIAALVPEISFTQYRSIEFPLEENCSWLVGGSGDRRYVWIIRLACSRYVILFCSRRNWPGNLRQDRVIHRVRAEPSPWNSVFVREAHRYCAQLIRNMATLDLSETY